MSRIEIEEGDILIRRVRNGWVAKSLSEADSEYMITDVYSETESTYGMAEALWSLLLEHFGSYFQQKRLGGIHITIKEQGYEQR